LAALGHIHYAQQIGGHIFYSGSLFVKDFGEAGEQKGFYLHTLDAANRLQQSIHIATPSRRLYRVQHDFRDDHNGFRVPLNPEDLQAATGAFVRLELKAYQDEADKIDKDDLRARLSEARELEIKIIRIPRENVRSEKILKLERLRDKLEEMARLKGETVPESVLSKADTLEALDPSRVLSMVTKMAGGGG
jgi:DNA repair exonuclease SbcCD nuclease subunit